MANVDSRYDVEIKLTITDRTTGEVVPEFSETIQKYYNMNYEAIVGLQRAIVPQMVETLVALGEMFAAPIAEARAKGKAGAPGQNK